MTKAVLAEDLIICQLLTLEIFRQSRFVSFSKRKQVIILSSVIEKDILSLEDSIIRIVFSEKKQSDVEFSKVSVRPFLSKGKRIWQLEQFKGNQVFHKNLNLEQLFSWIEQTGEKSFRQASLTAGGVNIHYTVFPDKIKRRESSNNLSAQAKTHDREKTYLLKEGENIPALVDLGVFSKDFRIIKSKYDKYKQINRFVELIDDCFSKSELENITILDFGCGKSYLTFIVYYYFTQIRKIRAKVIGFDLKKDVVENCNRIAKKYGYNGLEFFVNDVTGDRVFSGRADMMITLHACDIATDYALFYAIENRVKNIFSVPCCQHEINSQIKKGGDFDLLLSHGLFKERFSALLTDSLRAEILTRFGYETDVIEFVDFEHSPKNLMLRCELKKEKQPNLSDISELCKKYGTNPTLLKLAKEYSEKTYKE